MTTPEARQRAASPAREADLGGHFPALDGLRGLAMLGVLLFHTRVTILRPVDSVILRSFFHACSYGWAGVDLFFVLSGFLITNILLRTRGHAGYFRSFYMRRTLRIFPLYYATLVVLFFVANHLPWHRDDILWLGRHQSWFWLYSQNWLVLRLGGPYTGWDFIGHFWSLAVEEQFYLAWPLVVFLNPRRRLLGLCVAIVGIVPLLRCWLLGWGLFSPEELYFQTFTRIDSLVWGALLATAAQTPGLLRRLQPSARLLALAGVVWMICFSATRPSTINMHPAMQISGFTWMALISACIIIEAIVPPVGDGPASRLGGWLARALSARPLRSVGKISYAMYVFHWPVMYVGWEIFEKFGLDSLPVLASFCLFLTASGLATYALAFASWHLFEKHFLRLKRLFPRPD